MESLIDLLSVASAVVDGGPDLQLPPEWDDLAFFITYSFWGLVDRGALSLGSGNGKGCLGPLAGAGTLVLAGIQATEVRHLANFRAFRAEAWSPPLSPRECSSRMNS